MKKRELIIGIAIIVIFFGAIATVVLSKLYSSESYKQAKTNAEVSLENPLISGKSAGEYNKGGFAISYKIYSLKNSEQVMYEISNGCFLLGDKNESDTGRAYYLVHINTDTWKEPKLVGVTPNYLIFSVKKYTDAPEEERKKVAVEIKETAGNVGDRLFHKCIEYNELDFMEQLMMYEVISVEEVENEY